MPRSSADVDKNKAFCDCGGSAPAGVMKRKPVGLPVGTAHLPPGIQMVVDPQEV